LENETYYSARQNRIAAYHAAPARVSPMAGESYPAADTELELFLGQYLESAGVGLDGAGRPIYRGLLSPHIDYQRGGEVYARTWSAAAHTAREAELVIILGTDHYSEGLPISLTRQPYSTPYGSLPIPIALVDRLEGILGKTQAYAGEIHHCSEHSIDLAAVWLHFARRGAAVEMLPVLVGDLDALSSGQLESVVGTIQREIRRRRVLIVVAGDLAHVGPAFGGEPVSPARLEQLKAEDERILKTLNSSPAEVLQVELSALADNNVCGAHPLYLAARILGPARAELLGYAACPADEDNTSFVTIAGVGLV